MMSMTDDQDRIFWSHISQEEIFLSQEYQELVSDF